MADLSELNTRLDALREARASGTRAVEYMAGNGSRKRVEFKSDGEMASAIADIERQIAALGGQRVRNIKLQTRKGFSQ